MDLHLRGSLADCESFLVRSEILRVRNLIHLSEKSSQASDKGAMQQIFRIEELDRCWRSLGQPPERLSVFSLCIKWVSIEQLHDIIPIVFVELIDSVGDAIFETTRTFGHHCYGFIEVLDVIWLWFVTFFEEFGKSLRLESEFFTEVVPCPFDAVQRLLREHFQSAVGNFSIFNRIILTAVAFSLVRDDDLNVTFRTECSTLKQRNLILHATLIHISSGCNIIKRVGYNCQALEELITEDIFGRI